MTRFHLSPLQRRNIGKILPFGFVWLIFGIVYTLLEYGLLGALDYYPSTGNPYSSGKNLIATPLGCLLTGLLLGTFEVLYFHKLFANTSFGVKILTKTTIYLLFVCLFLISLTFLGNSIILNTSIFAPAVFDTVLTFLRHFAFWSVIAFMAVAIGISLFVSEVSDNLGQGVMQNFLLGKYHKPRKEERIFMFLDMKSSTTIAEKIGHVRFFELLRDYYADMTEAILKSSGEIYKYVGDEIIISWKMKNGIKNNNCVQCFFYIKNVFSIKSEKYLNLYGITPEFKAGLHFGQITVGEMGAIKKEIAFSGDVLNTTARIQNLCNTYESNLLISSELVNILNLEKNYNISIIGETELRGRDAKINLYKIEIKY